MKWACQELWPGAGGGGDTQSSGHKQPLTTLVEPAFFDDRHLIHGGSVTRCHLAWDSSGQQDMQEAWWTERSLQDKREESVSVGGGFTLAPPPSTACLPGPSGCSDLLEPGRVGRPAPRAQTEGERGPRPQGPQSWGEGHDLPLEPYSGRSRAP